MKRESEGGFQDTIVEVAHSLGWIANHIRPLRRSNGAWETPVQYDGEGFPDLQLLRTRVELPKCVCCGQVMGGHVVAELKMPGNRPSDKQNDWLNAFEHVGTPAYVWTPKDMDEIRAVLEGKVI